jgi:hypothetical protein
MKKNLAAHQKIRKLVKFHFGLLFTLNKQTFAMCAAKFMLKNTSKQQKPT